MKYRCVCLSLVLGVAAAIADENPVRIFVLAGQSNMEGQAVVDLAGKDYNGGKGTLKSLFEDKSKIKLVKHLRDEKGNWVVRDDVFVRYQRERQPLLQGKLGVGYAVYGGKHHFGPELQFGHEVANTLGGPILLVKTAWGGKSLVKDFRPPSSGGATGKYYQLMLEQVQTAREKLTTEIPAWKDRKTEIAGFVWYHGWNDGVDPKNAILEYEQNLVNLINDVRKEWKSPKLPVVIGELTGPWVDAPKDWEKLRQSQAAAAKRPEFKGTVAFVPTRSFVRKPEDSPNPSHGHHEFGNAETYILVGQALGKAMAQLVSAND